MASTVQDVANRAREILNDDGKVRWSDADLYLWVGDALDLIMRHAPGYFVQRGTHTTTAGALQTLSQTRGASLVRVVGLTQFDRTALDLFSPGWKTATAGTADQWAPGDGPLQFYLRPPSAGSVSLSVDYVQSPAEVTALTDALPLPDDFVGPLADYVIGMAEAKDATHINSGRSQAFLQAFASKLGIGAKG